MLAGRTVFADALGHRRIFECGSCWNHLEVDERLSCGHCDGDRPTERSRRTHGAERRSDRRGHVADEQHFRDGTEGCPESSMGAKRTSAARQTFTSLRTPRLIIRAEGRSVRRGGLSAAISPECSRREAVCLSVCLSAAISPARVFAEAVDERRDQPARGCASTRRHAEAAA